MILLLFALAASPASIPRGATLMKDWALSRCIGRSAGQPFQDDAYKSAAALLEKSNASVDAFNDIDRLVDQYLARCYSGSVPSQYDMLKCIDVYHSTALDQLVTHHKH